MGENPTTGGDPTALVECTSCGEVYPAQSTGEGDFRPIGIETQCSCGNDTFTQLAE